MDHTDNLPFDGATLGSISQDPATAAVAAEMFVAAIRSDGVSDFLVAALSSLATAVGSHEATLAAAALGQWSVLATSGSPPPMPVELLAEVLDREAPQVEGPWVAAPIGLPEAGEVLALRFTSDDQAAGAAGRVRPLAALLGEALAAVRGRRRQNRRVHRLETILEIANEWNQTHEMEPLLVQMAEAATRLLQADRASIFLWDKKDHSLVGRPALGVEGGQLRIPDDRGIVGQVIQTGQPRRVDMRADQDQIDRAVDAKTGYQTKTLLCVPLRGRNGQMFGAFEMINKLSGNFTTEDEAGLVELAAHAAVALENTQQHQQMLSTNRQLTEQAAEGIQLIGQSPAIEALQSIIRRVADTDLAVLILGENGTGKEVVNQSIHYLSSRRDHPCIAVNCAAIAETLAESELFGHEKGAFTDAHEARQGKFELASGGTLFLDEIGDLSLSSQAKLLRVLEEKVLVRVGGSTPIHTDARVIAATNQNLAEMVRQRKFREDLYFRLNVVTIELPPLRERIEDVMLLAEHFLNDFAQKARRNVPTFSAAARARLESHPWPGNVRELRNLMERLAYLSTSDQIEAEDLAFILSPTGGSDATATFTGPLAEATADFQVQYIRQAARGASGNMSRAAERLGLHRSNLYRKMRQLGMPIPE